MSDLEQIEDREERALERRVEQFKDSPRLEVLIRVLVGPLQTVEDDLWALYTDRWVDTAEGVQLDNLGWIVGQAREGRTDTEYRPWIKARVFINRSTGRVDDSLHVLDLIQPGVDTTITEIYPAAYDVSALDLTADAEAVFRLLTQAKPAGVAMSFQYSDVDPALTFTFSDDATLMTGDTDKGFGDATNPAVGGQLRGVFQL